MADNPTEGQQEYDFPVRWADDQPPENLDPDATIKETEYQLKRELAKDAEILTLDEVLNHRNKIIKIYLSAYDRAIEAHPLLAGTFLDIVRKTQFKGKNDIAGGYALALEACQASLIDGNLRENLLDFDNTAINDISEVIMRESELPKERILKNLSSPKREKA